MDNKDIIDKPLLNMGVPHNKQKEVLLSDKKRIYLNWGRRCLSENTMVWTENGLIEVKNLSVGDMVWSLTDYGNYELRPVTHIHINKFYHKPKPMIAFRCRGKTIKTTFDHPFYCDGKYRAIYAILWKRINEKQRRRYRGLCRKYKRCLHIPPERDFLDEDFFLRGDRKGVPSSHRDLEIGKIQFTEAEDNYAITVEKNHNFFIGYNGFLTHNSGKSFLAGMKTAISSILVQGNYYIIAPTGGNAKKIYWDDILKVIFKDSPLVDKQFVRRLGRKDYNEVGFNENEMSITIDYIENAKVTLPNGKMVTINHDTRLPRSKIVLYGATEPDNILGVGLAGVVLDECAKMPNFKYVWGKVVRPMLGDKKGWATFISTPLGIHNPWYTYTNLAKSDPDKYFYSHATAYDNPYFPDSEIEEARADALAENDLATFEQEWLAEFVNPQGAIFPEFDQAIHTFHAKELPKEGTYCMGIDFGFSPDPAVLLSCLIDADGNWWVFDEVYDTKLDDDRIANVIKNKMMDTVFTRIVADSSQTNSIALLRRVYRVPVQPSTKGADSIMAGIRQIHALLRVDKNGKPKLRIAKHLLNTIREFESYSRKRDAQGNYYNVPEDANNHAIDALRYIVGRMLARERKVGEPVTERRYSPVTGRPLD